MKPRSKMLALFAAAGVSVGCGSSARDRRTTPEPTITETETYRPPGEAPMTPTAEPAARAPRSQDLGSSAGFDAEKASEPVSDATLLQRMHAHLRMAELGLSPEQIDALDVRVENGVATVSGTVDTFEQRQRIEDVIARTGAHVRVVNLLSVREETEGTEEIEEIEETEDYEGIEAPDGVHP